MIKQQQQKQQSDFYIHTFGCRLNHSESSMIVENLKKEGYKLSYDYNSSWHIINSCVVTNEAVKKCNQLIRRIKRKNSKANIALLGCYPQADKTSFKTQADIILGSKEKYHLASYITKYVEQKRRLAAVNKIKTSNFVNENLPIGIKKTRVNLKIQDGCDFYCSFCIVPFARGRAHSRSIEDIVKEAKYLSKSDFKELVLTGVNLGLYKDGKYNFLDLIDKLLEIPEIVRIRVSSIEPTTIDEKYLLKIRYNQPKFAKFLHLPLQSGSNKVLTKMRRRYNTQELTEYINYARELMPDIGIGTDIIVGFPNEDEKEFNRSVEYFKNSNFNFAHVFPYSKRDGTRSASFIESIGLNEIKRRVKIVREISKNKWIDFCRSRINSIESVIMEKEVAKDIWQGYTSNYLRINAKGINLKNKLCKVKLEDIDNNSTLKGKII